MRDLAGALRNELSVAAAVTSWVQRWRGEPGFARAARLVELGCRTRWVVSSLEGVFGLDARVLAALLRTAEETGASAADAVDRLAAALEDGERDRAAGQAAATAARKSARAMVLMPLLGTPLLLLGDVPVTDGTGVGLAAVAVALMYAGSRWVDRLVPRPQDDDAALHFCELVSCALVGGASPGRACSEVAPLVTPTAGAARLVRLGFTWPEALAGNSNEILRRAGLLLLRQERSGMSVAQELSLLTRDERSARRAAFDVKVRAAPVRMIWPLVACSLPAFCALTVIPLVRGIAGSM